MKIKNIIKKIGAADTLNKKKLSTKMNSRSGQAKVDARKGLQFQWYA